MLDSVNWIAILAATIAAFVFGGAYYGVLGKQWMAAAGLTTEDTKPTPMLFVLAFLCQLVMAFVLAGVIFHADGYTLANGLTAGGLIWLGFVATTQIVNHRYQGAPWSLTMIDCGHWLGRC
ncbi:DUF1761 domain-containing protein [Breoghania sp. L-A4]|uniref:DUF1761 domain-containing protein n=1 Tax=Breoghania sp. L-A4 TaxID=2304600 RepID=UPI0032049C5C